MHRQSPPSFSAILIDHHISTHTASCQRTSDHLDRTAAEQTSKSHQLYSSLPHLRTYLWTPYHKMARSASFLQAWRSTTPEVPVKFNSPKPKKPETQALNSKMEEEHCPKDLHFTDPIRSRLSQEYGKDLGGGELQYGTLNNCNRIFGYARLSRHISRVYSSATLLIIQTPMTRYHKRAIL